MTSTLRLFIHRLPPSTDPAVSRSNHGRPRAETCGKMSPGRSMWMPHASTATSVAKRHPDNFRRNDSEGHSYVHQQPQDPAEQAACLGGHGGMSRRGYRRRRIRAPAVNLKTNRHCSTPNLQLPGSASACRRRGSRVSPVIHADSGEARKTTAGAMSSGWPIRPSGVDRFHLLAHIARRNPRGVKAFSFHHAGVD